jgi:hypothetical protein
MKKNKTVQEFPVALEPVTITAGSQKGESEIHIRETFTPSRKEGGALVAAARVGTRHHANTALILFQKDAWIAATDGLCGPCVVRTDAGFQCGKLSGRRETQDSICVVVAGLKPLAGRTLSTARSGTAKLELARKYSRLAAKTGSKGRRTVLLRKAVGFNAAAEARWESVFRELAHPTNGGRIGLPAGQEEDK